MADRQISMCSFIIIEGGGGVESQMTILGKIGQLNGIVGLKLLTLEKWY